MRGIVGAVRDLFRSSPAFRTGAILVLVLLALAIASFAAPYGPSDRRVVPIDRPPSLQYPFGTTSLGQDVFWLTTYAIRNSLVIAGLAVIISRTLAVLMGSFSGYVGGAVDRVLSGFTDSFIVIPRLPLLILISFMIRGSLNMLWLALILGLLDWAWPSKRYRSQVLSFFLSSRRRHTSSLRDWSSDVCSSDLAASFAIAVSGPVGRPSRSPVAAA